MTRELEQYINHFMWFALVHDLPSVGCRQRIEGALSGGSIPPLVLQNCKHALTEDRTFCKEQTVVLWGMNEQFRLSASKIKAFVNSFAKAWRFGIEFRQVRQDVEKLLSPVATTAGNGTTVHYRVQVSDRLVAHGAEWRQWFSFLSRSWWNCKMGSTKLLPKQFVWFQILAPNSSNWEWLIARGRSGGDMRGSTGGGDDDSDHSC